MSRSNTEELTKDWLWDTQFRENGEWHSMCETPFYSYADAEAALDSAILEATNIKAFRIIPVIP